MKRIVIYLRLSKEDDLNRDESNSISNQRELIKRFIRKDKNLRQMEIVEIKDDGYTGKNMNRPGMQQLLELIRKRQVQVVIVKDMSRFSRDYLVLGQYTEQIFPFMGIRFIAINDNYDSDTSDGGIAEIDVAFKAVLYDFYSEDISKKIKSTLAEKKRQGCFLNVYAPYGYRKDPADHHALIIEPEGAEIVRRIFREYLAGKSMYQIAKDLNRDGVDTPAQYIRKRDGVDYTFRNNSNAVRWIASFVTRILKNEIYIGTLVYHKAGNPEVAAPHSVAYPKSQWKRVEGFCPAIISMEDFEKVRQKSEDNKTFTSKYERHFLSGKIICGGCGFAMYHDWCKAGGRPKYRCQNRFYLTDNEKCVKSVRDKDLEEIIGILAHEMLERVPDVEQFMHVRNEKLRRRIDEATQRLREMQKSLKKLLDDQFASYEGYKDGLTDRATYLEQKDSYEQMIRQLRANITRQEEAIADFETPEEGTDVLENVKDLRAYVKPDRAFAEIFIKEIRVYADKRIDVVWNMEPMLINETG